MFSFTLIYTWIFVFPSGNIWASSIYFFCFYHHELIMALWSSHAQFSSKSNWGTAELRPPLHHMTGRRVATQYRLISPWLRRFSLPKNVGSRGSETLFGWSDKRLALGSKEQQSSLSKTWLFIWGLLEFPCLGTPPYSKQNLVKRYGKSQSWDCLLWLLSFVMRVWEVCRVWFRI